MSLPRVHFGMQFDIFALFSRPELGQISKTNRRFNAIIEKHFATSPYLVLGSLHYNDGKWKWSTNVLNFAFENLSVGAPGVTTLPMSDSQIAQLPFSKFLLFKYSKFIFKNTSNAIVVLKPHSHLWKNGRLVVSMKKFMRSMEFASIVNTSKHLTLVVPGALRILSELLRGKCKHLVITDPSNNPTKQLPINDITNFFFSKSETEAQPSCLAIKTRYSPKHQLEKEIISGFGQKFLTSALPPRFAFVKQYGGDMDLPQLSSDSPLCSMPPKKCKPPTPMETRSRAKAKNNTESQPPVLAKRSRKDTSPLPEHVLAEDDVLNAGCASRNDSLENIQKENCKPSHVNIQKENCKPSHVLNVELNELYQENEFIAELEQYDGQENFTIVNAIELLNTNYDNWKSHFTGTSSADDSIKAFISYENLHYPDNLADLANKCGIDVLTLINAFENGLDTTNEIITQASNSSDESSVHMDQNSLKKKPGRPSKKRGKASIGRQRKEKNQAKSWNKNYRDNEAAEQRNKRLSQMNNANISRRSNETQEERNKRLSQEHARPLYHLFNQNAHPIEGETHTYGQLFFLDTQEASNLRANNPVNKGIDQSLFLEIENELRSINPLIKSYHMIPLNTPQSIFNALHFAGKLMHQWAVDMWTRIEGDLLEFQKLKNISYQSATASNLNGDLNTDRTDEISRKTILYSDYPGSIKYYQEEFRKSMIMAKRFGPPDLFITITFGSDNEDLKKAINVQLPDGDQLQQQTNFRPDMNTSSPSHIIVTSFGSREFYPGNAFSSQQARAKFKSRGVRWTRCGDRLDVSPWKLRISRFCSILFFG
ncbi:hypothetical protein DdX_14841 [Ditylenchus destructor]|uniref:Uncharacterized protein n=1 Tax=Ditylenchus destructor TaxID=166010 RepID=A0AAD4MWA2_9BILA|nr:hypothetical protein DdX_14841 [Ditylenchus destructor]